MAKVRKIESSETSRAMRPAISPEARENQLIALASNLAEQQLRDGTASSQVITHYLKLGTVQAKLELKKMESEIKLQEAKVKALEGAEELKALYSDALKAMRTYSGQGGSDDSEDEY